jgi:UDP-glucose 4-epimerase
MLVKNWNRDVAVRYSGAVRAGDPFSLLADDAALRQLPFDWQISIEQGIVDYVKWFKDQVRD